MKSVEVRVKGPGSGRESAVRALAAAGLHIVVIRDVNADSTQRLPSPKRDVSETCRAQPRLAVPQKR